MRTRPVFLLLFLLLGVLPAGSQRPNAYFSLSSNKTYLPGEKVSVRVYATNVEALEFRVYRVKDPMAFFERLESPHGFGHTTPKEAVETESLLERFHDWKHGLWVNVRNFFLFLLPGRLGKDWEHTKNQFDDLRTRLERETDYEAEAAVLPKVRPLFRDEDGIEVPRVYPKHSTAKVLTMERLGGAHLDEFLAGNP